MNPIRVVIVDDQESSRLYLKSVLEKDAEIEVVGMAASGFEGVNLTQTLLPDVVLMDVQMETYTAGITATFQIHRDLPSIKIIIITIHEEDELLFRAYAAGAMDYIIKTADAQSIIRSVKEVYVNQLMLRPIVAEKIRQEFSRYMNYRDHLVDLLNVLTKLTNSEMDILKAVYNGYSTKEIADMRYVSQQTVKTQINSMLKKFGMKRMKEVIQALEQIDFVELMEKF